MFLHYSEKLISGVFVAAFRTNTAIQYKNHCRTYHSYFSLYTKTPGVNAAHSSKKDLIFISVIIGKRVTFTYQK